jgi:hypothetical protein
MLVTDLFETQQVHELDLNKIGRGIGRAVGGTAQAIGAAAGGIAGIPGAVRQGYQAGKNVVGQGIPNAQQPAQQPGTSTGAASTFSTITNPETGKLYTKAELRAKYNNASAVASPTAPAPTTATAPAGTTATARASVRQAKQAIDTAVGTISKVRNRDRQSVISYANKAVTAIPNTPARPAVTTTKSVTPAWTGRSAAPAKPAKISVPPSSGAPTADERAKLDQRIQAALAKQPVAESLQWTADFDPSLSLLKQIQRS